MGQFAHFSLERRVFMPRTDGDHEALRPTENSDPAACEFATLGDLSHIETAWADLHQDLAEDNPFFSPWALKPALEVYADARVKLACIWSDSAKNKLIGFAPVRAMRGYANMPFAYWRIWLHPHCYYGAPLLRKGYEQKAFSALVHQLCDRPGGAEIMLQLPLLGADGAVYRTAAALNSARMRCIYKATRHKRAIFYNDQSARHYPENTLRKKRRKEMRRLQNRLSEIGAMRIHAPQNATQCERWIEEFLLVENNSWKGEQGTALASSAPDKNWFRAAIMGAYNSGQLQFFRFDLDDTLLAMFVSIGGGQLFSLKICYDPQFARYSPGVMLAVEKTIRLANSPGFESIDSCAVEGHSMINRLWPSRRSIVTLNISSAAIVGKTALRFCRGLETLRASLSKNNDEIGKTKAKA